MKENKILRVLFGYVFILFKGGNEVSKFWI